MILSDFRHPTADLELKISFSHNKKALNKHSLMNASVYPLVNTSVVASDSAGL